VASIAAHAVGVSLGCRILRVHDVAATRRVVDTLGAVLESGSHNVAPIPSRWNSESAPAASSRSGS
ncbi:MAG: hypothetical protein J2O47_03125, partial [Acidimicrobiaceae bacterium]|nr:hypothetical protein [Acidimicrobiaceae bacterium]